MTELKENCMYFVKQEFFIKVNEVFLKQNKETTSRPHYFPFPDEQTGLYWLIPCSSQIEKYEGIISSKEARHKPHNHIQIIKVSGKKEVFLYQDMFPVAANYIDKPYSNQYGLFEIKDLKSIDAINRNARKIIKLLRHGVKFTPTQPDINRIEKLMMAEVEQEKSQAFSTNQNNISQKKPSIHDRIEVAKADIAKRASEQPATARPTRDANPHR